MWPRPTSALLLICWQRACAGYSKMLHRHTTSLMDQLTVGLPSAFRSLVVCGSFLHTVSRVRPDGVCIRVLYELHIHTYGTGARRHRQWVRHRNDTPGIGKWGRTCPHRVPGKFNDALSASVKTSALVSFHQTLLALHLSTHIIPGAAQLLFLVTLCCIVFRHSEPRSILYHMKTGTRDWPRENRTTQCTTVF